jgi:hypothetical protein
MRINATAVYYSHETRDFEEAIQDFEGDSYEDIASDYFGIYGDTLATLTVDGHVVYDNTAAAEAEKAEWADV